MKTADSMSRTVEASCGPKGLVSWYLMASLAYYHLDRALLTDGRFDEMAKTLAADWENITHDHKHFITPEDLDAGSLLLSLEQFPVRVRAATQAVLAGLGQGLTPEERARLFDAPFVPPERLRFNAGLYPYGNDGRSWGETTNFPRVRVRQRVRSQV